MGESGLGAIWRADGVDFRLRAPDATAVELCLFSPDEPAIERRRVTLDRGDDGWWRARLDGVGPGLLYGYRVDGPYRPHEGLRFDRSKLLLDPRAGAIAGRARWSPSLVAGNRLDSAPWMPRSVVVDPAFDWAGDVRPAVPWEHCLIYECHVRGLTRLHPLVAPELRGTYLGLAQPPVLEHLLSLGVTAVELMPVQHFVAERHLLTSGRPNYWGYSPIGWFAPHGGYAGDDRGGQLHEFKTMVRELHRAGLEVLVDVVFNHTAEGDADGLTLGPRGIDNRGLYRLDGRDRSRYVDYTGCGNTVDLRRPENRELVLAALRYWAGELRVDGFRFDLGGILGRGDEAFSATAPFFEELAADPLLSQRKLIAEPWDLGPDGYLAGRFPAGWREWNDRYRDAVRAFWRGDRGTADDLATRLSGSSDLFGGRPGGPLTGVNYVSCHDGFTLEDLVSYRRKHNWANGERNRDGRDENLSRNWGVEGPTDDDAVLARRRRAKRNLIATLALSAGVPMLAHGDEIGRTQQGNNNAYCHDSPLTWVDWRLDAEDRDLLAFTRQAFALRRRLAVFARRDFFSAGEFAWRTAEGRPLGPGAWGDPELKTLVAVIAAGAEDGLALVLNAGREGRVVRLPEPPAGGWRLRLATAGAELDDGGLRIAAYSLAVLTGGEASPSGGNEEARGAAASSRSAR